MSILQFLFENKRGGGLCGMFTILPALSSSVVALITALIAVALRKVASKLLMGILVLSALSCLFAGISTYFDDCGEKNRNNAVIK